MSFTGTQNYFQKYDTREVSWTFSYQSFDNTRAYLKDLTLKKKFPCNMTIFVYLYVSISTIP